STPIQTSLKPSIPTQEQNTRPQTRAQKRRRTDEDEHLQKRRRTNPPSSPAPPAVFQELVGIHKRGKKRSRKDRQSSPILAAASLYSASVPHTRGNKPICKTEDEPLDEQGQQSETESRLSKENLKKLQSQLKPPQEMEPADRVRKRGTVTRQLSVSDLNPETASASVRSQKSTGSLKFYRYNILEQARVYVRCEYPPPHIQALLDDIFNREVLVERKVKITRIAKETAQKFSSKTQGASREDDLLELLNSAFDELFPTGMFNCPRKADWNPNLKPNILQDDVWNLDALGQANNETDDVVERPPKRQQADQSSHPPITSQPNPQRLTAPPQSRQDGAVKSPRPDSTIGHQHSTITNALIGLGLSKLKDDDLLRVLQLQEKLFSDPTIDYLNVRFPIQVVEGKAYATGKPMFEAENQAVVSGACMVNLQQQLIDLHEIIFPDAEQSRTPFAFSVCTEGPVIQYWVNYCSVEEGIRMHYMNPLCICNGALHDTLEVLLMKWEKLMGWYGDVFLTDVSKKLHRIARHIARPGV
ncbi:MAG: hypothetical protein Q9196_005327, partial [Gyalolechia fulgens]